MRRYASMVLLLAGGLGLWLAARQHAPLLQLRRDYHLNWDEPLRNSPPLVSFTSVALGGFRGIIADVLWLRATKLQEEKKYFELVQLADWITKLEPRFALVWAFHGWNMAYNISVMLDDPADRWRWVKHGFELMRDEGLFYNPGDPQLHRELGWIFQHKMGGMLDQAHFYYKRAWAAEMAELFDGPRPDYAFCRANPNDARVMRLRDVYKLEPARMEEVDNTYGPLDWRAPEAHAIYWAWRGRPYAKGFDAVQLDRMIFQSMQDAFWQGRLIIDPVEDVFVPAPNVDILPRVRKAYEDAIAAHPDEESIKSAHKNLLHDALLILYLNHYASTAREVFEEMQTRYPSAVGGKGFEKYIYDSFTEQVGNMSQREALAMIEGLLYQSAFWIALGEPDRSEGMVQVARYCWLEYMKTRTEPKLRERTGLPPLDQIRREALQRAGETARGVAAKARLEAARKQETPVTAVPAPE